MTEVHASVIRDAYGAGWDLDKPEWFEFDPIPAGYGGAIVARFPMFCHPVDKRLMLTVGEVEIKGHLWPMTTNNRQDWFERMCQPITQAQAEAKAPALAAWLRNGHHIFGWFWHPGIKEVVCAFRDETQCLCHGPPAVSAFAPEGRDA